jgi:hypothetical protein
MRRAGFLLSIALAFLFLAGILFPQGSMTQLTTTISGLCTAVTALLPVAAMLMILVGAVVYAAGQIMGAETRARANVWAAACVTGALMAMLINAVAPPILGSIYGGTISCSGGTVGGGSCGGSTCSSGEACISNKCCPTGTVAVCSGMCCPTACSTGEVPVCITAGP